MNQSAGLSPFRPRILHTAYHVENIDRATAFYVGVLGMREQMRIPLPSGERECVLSFVDDGGKPTGSGIILMWNPDAPKAPTHNGDYSRFIIKVSDLDAAVTHLREQDTKITVPPTNAQMNIRYAMCEDPDGYTIELMQLGPAR